ncbi:AraC family transcriptional regulator [Aurantibacter crassamenti]|uniref:AraC family transcriptional regulator n=1 Tax=Aurantibacter crassamenti TaxID=1837375 RepID=UPI00193A24BB|nr:AraC family transcriptional regulator [Aurantibacter crassamenti]MBM1105800.1 AraC family transcriptional regulator [Aurantibacter crassamenti]
MKSALQKSPIPKTHAFVVQSLRQTIFDPNWHFHPEYQLFMVLKGKGTRFIGDHVKSFQPGDITFLGPDLPHLWRSDTEESENGAEGIVVYFNENFIGDTLLYKEEGILLRKLFRKGLRGFDVTNKTADIISRMILELPKLEGFDAVLGLMHILNLLSQSDDIKLLASSGYTNTLREGDTERMNKVYAYVMKHFKRKIPIAELATLTNMTPTSFSRYFKTHANKTFSEFVSEIRIGHACKLLIEKKMNASQVCYESGFQTMSNFNRQFKTITNRTPLDYKKRYNMTNSN